MSKARKTVTKRVLDARLVRRVRDGFSWIDRRFVREGWIDRLSLEESGLYFFLVAVADKDGLSFYSDGRIGTTLRLDAERLARARGRLVELGLVAWEAPLYQVLELPATIADGLRRSVR
jgi:hypothetical protein